MTEEGFCLIGKNSFSKQNVYVLLHMFGKLWEHLTSGDDIIPVLDLYSTYASVYSTCCFHVCLNLTYLPIAQ